MSPQTNTPPTREGDPFMLAATEFPFADARIIQLIAFPTHLHWDKGGGGFYMEIDRPLDDHFQPTKLITGAGKRSKVLPLTVCVSTQWLSGSVGRSGTPAIAARLPPTRKEPAAHSLSRATTVLAVLEKGRGIKLTAGGLASKNLSQAVRDHTCRLARDAARDPHPTRACPCRDQWRRGPNPSRVPQRRIGC